MSGSSVETRRFQATTGFKLWQPPPTVTRVTRYAPAPGSIEQLIPLWLVLPHVLQMCWLRQLTPNRHEPLFQNLHALVAAVIWGRWGDISWGRRIHGGWGGQGDGDGGFIFCDGGGGAGGNRGDGERRVREEDGK
jgi:hypothetical protein